MGYGLAAVAAYICWIAISKIINEKFDEVTTEWKISFWRNAVWVSSAYLWAAWLSHDVANIAVYLPRQLGYYIIINCCYLFYNSTFLYFLHPRWTNTERLF